MKSARRVALLPLLLASEFFLVGTLAGCGQKGPLYLPDAATSVVTRPAAATPDSAPNSPQTVDSPVAPAAPAPEVTAPDDPDKKKNAATPAPKP